MKTHEEIKGINFNLGGCVGLTRENFDANYGDKDNNGKRKKNDHHNLNKSDLDRVWKTLQKSLEKNAKESKKADSKKVTSKKSSSKK